MAFFVGFLFALLALRFPPVVCPCLTLLMENEAGRTVRCVFWSWASSEATWTDVMWNFVVGQTPNSESGLQSMQGTFIYDPHISFIFLTSKKNPLINSRSQQKRIIAHLWHYRIVSALLIDSSGSRESGSGLALKTIDPDADGGCRNMRESWKMRMFQSEKLLPWCKFNRPTRKREQRLL